MGQLADFKDDDRYAAFNYFQLKIQRLTEVNRMLAHNLRGSVANIQMLTEALKDLDSPNAPGEAFFTKDEIAEYIQQSSDTMLAAMERIMALAKSDPELGVQMEACDVQEVLESVCKQLSYLLMTARANVDLYLEQREIMYPKVYLESILYNLISNAAKNAVPGKLLHIEVRMHMKNGRPVLEVSDNGKGMDLDQHRDKLFKAFHSTDTSGTHGLGLYLVRSQVESLGGHIKVHSMLNAGTSFTITLGQ